MPTTRRGRTGSEAAAPTPPARAQRLHCRHAAGRCMADGSSARCQHGLTQQSVQTQTLVNTSTWDSAAGKGVCVRTRRTARPTAAGRDYAAQKDSPVGRVSIPVSEHVSAGVPRPGCLYTAELGVPADEPALPASPFGPVCLLWALVGRDTERDHGARVLGLERSTRHEEFQDGKAW